MNLNCKICNSKLCEKNLIKINNAPISAQDFRLNKNIKSKINLIIKECSGCGIVQVINRPVNYYKKVIRSVGFSPQMLKFRQNQFKNFTSKYKLKNKSAIEVGCGRGDYLEIIKKYIINSYGLEGSKSNYILAKKKGLNVINGFISNKNFKITNKKFNAFFIFSYLEHIPNINDFLSGLNNNLEEDSIGIIEVPNFEKILKKNLYSEFIVDHLYYFTNKTLDFLLQRNGFEIIKIKHIWGGYILSATVRKRKNLKIDLNYHLKAIKKQLLNIIKKYSNKQKVVIWGAGHQSLTLLSSLKLEKKIKYIVDSASFKQNKYAPGTNLKVLTPTILKRDNIKLLLVVAAGFNNEVCKIAKGYNQKITIAKFDNNTFSKI